jgi:hypothetical protein
MDCIECKTASPEGNHFCGQCGAELGRTLDETVRKKGFRDRQATEMEITESVANRLMKWGGWLAAIAALIIASFGIALRLIYTDARTALEVGKTQIQSTVADGKNTINTAVAEGKKNIDAVRQTSDALKGEVKGIESDINGYKEVMT